MGDHTRAERLPAVPTAFAPPAPARRPAAPAGPTPTDLTSTNPTDRTPTNLTPAGLTSTGPDQAGPDQTGPDRASPTLAEVPGAADRPPPAGGSSAIVWARTAERRRPRLTREAIVDAAVAMADAEGLEAVSIRRVAAALDARPMSLYSHFDRKDDLLALMNDQVAAEVIVPEPLPTDWRDALRAIAHRTRDSSLRHPWVLQTLACHPRLGPNGLRHAEQSAAAVAALPLPPRRRAAMLRAVDTYTLGHVTAELRERQGYLGGADRAEVQRYLTGVLDGGQYPHLAQFHSQDLVLVGENARDSFAEGLEWLLAGIAAAIGAAPS